jgi:predicted ArsR family transcriptional regulator
MEATVCTMSNEIGRLKELLLQKERLLLMSRAGLASAMVDHFGEEAEAVIQSFLKDAARDWAAKAAEADRRANKKNDIRGLTEFLWEPLREEGFEFTCEQTVQGYQLKVTRCPVAEIAKALGLEKWGYMFHCMGDESICEGYNPAIGMTRTKTLMEGDEYCNHLYHYRERAKGT